MSRVSNVPILLQKSFSLMSKNSPGYRRDFRVQMWGTSSPDEKLTGDLGNVIEATRIGARCSDRLTAGELSPGNFGLLQQYLPGGDLSRCTTFATEGTLNYSITSSARASSVGGTSMPSVLAVFRLITSLNLTGA